MLVRIIGGHGGVAPGFRNTSYLIDGKLLIDAGSSALGLKIDEQKLIDNILISHSHLDHITDLAFMCDNCFGLMDAPFEVYCSRQVRKSIQKHLMNDSIWPDFSKLPSKNNPTICYNDLKDEQEMAIGGYLVKPVRVNHYGEAFGFIVEKGKSSVLFTQDTGPTDRIWEVAKEYSNLKAIITEVSFPNQMAQIAASSLHHTPLSLQAEIAKMPPDIPIFLGHLKPNYQTQIYKQIEELNCDRLNILGCDDTNYMF